MILSVSEWHYSVFLAHLVSRNLLGRSAPWPRLQEETKDEEKLDHTATVWLTWSSVHILNLQPYAVVWE